MITVQPIQIDQFTCIAIDVSLPKTRLLSVQTHTGYIMCGALDVHLLNTRLHERRIIAGRAIGVKTIDELLAAPLESITDEAYAIGVRVGMIVKDALCVMCEKNDNNQD